MASYDSDSSIEDDDQSGTSTNVLLGYATKDTVDDNISQLGGEPVQQLTTILDILDANTEY